MKQVSQSVLKVYQAYCEEKGKTPMAMRAEITSPLVENPTRRIHLACQLKDMTPRQVKQWMTAKAIRSY